MQKSVEKMCPGRIACTPRSFRPALRRRILRAPPAARTRPAPAGRVSPRWRVTIVVVDSRLKQSCTGRTINRNARPVHAPAVAATFTRATGRSGCNPPAHLHKELSRRICPQPPRYVFSATHRRGYLALPKGTYPATSSSSHSAIVGDD